LNRFAAFNSRIALAHPDHAAILRGLAWVTLFVLVGKLSGAAKEMAIAWRYGTGAQVDGFLFVQNLVSWPLALWFSVLTLVLVPLAARLKRESPDQVGRFNAELAGAALLLGIALAFAARLALPALIAAPWAGLSPQAVAAAQAAAPGMALLLPLGVLIALCSAWMLAAGWHANTLAEGVPALAIALAVLAGDGGVAALVIGSVAGFALHLACLALPLAARGAIALPRFALRSPAWRGFGCSFAVLLAGNALMSLVDLIDLWFAAHLGAGALATLSYATRVLALLLGLGGTAIARATLPVFSSAPASRSGAVHALALRWVAIMLAAGACALAAVWALAPLAIRLLFQRGAFQAQDTAAVAAVLRYGALQLPFYFGALVLVSSLVARGRHRAVALGAMLNLPVKAAANLLLAPRLGLPGIALATGVMYLFSFSLLFLYASHLDKEART
jgi:peptidoglycan biosynthesis protein MviN/MurJ (putative lipid II flippase)